MTVGGVWGGGGRWSGVVVEGVWDSGGRCMGWWWEVWKGKRTHNIYNNPYQGQGLINPLTSQKNSLELTIPPFPSLTLSLTIFSLPPSPTLPFQPSPSLPSSSLHDPKDKVKTNDSAHSPP